MRAIIPTVLLLLPSAFALRTSFGAPGESMTFTFPNNNPSEHNGAHNFTVATTSGDYKNVIPIRSKSQSSNTPETNDSPESDDTNPGKTITTPTGQQVADIAGASSQISDHGGPVMTGIPNMYVIFYGTFTATQQSIIKTYMTNLGSSPWLHIITGYSGTKSGTITGNTTFVSTFANSTYMGTALTDTDVQDIVTTALADKTFTATPDTNGIYYVLTASNVNQGTTSTSGRTTTVSGFCTQYCGWHSYFSYTYGGTTVTCTTGQRNCHSGTTGGTTVVIKYAWIGDPSTCPDECAPTQNEAVSPNSDVGVDAMLSVISHETAETITDPELSTWYDTSGNECADKCAWTFNNTYYVTGTSGAQYNVQLGGGKYLIQQDWVNIGKGYCGITYP